MSSKDGKNSLLKNLTQARIALKRIGTAISTPEQLSLKYAHKRASEAIETIWQVEELEIALKALHCESLQVETNVNQRDQYLQRPDLGKQLTYKSVNTLQNLSQCNHYDIAWIVSNGLSATAIHRHFLPLWQRVREDAFLKTLRFSPVILAPFSRVAISDCIGEALGAKLSIIFIGERPGGCAVDSLSIYLTYHPQVGRVDAERNCLSNIRPPFGTGYDDACKALVGLIVAALEQKCSGTHLSLPKEETATSLTLIEENLISE